MAISSAARRSARASSQAARFVEKPDAATAGRYRRGRPARLERRHLPDARRHLSRRAASHAPEIVEAARRRWRRAARGRARLSGRRGLRRLAVESIDYAVMEKADKVAVAAGRDRLVGHRQLGRPARSRRSRTARAMRWPATCLAIDARGCLIRSRRAAGRGDRGRGSGDRRDRGRGADRAPRRRASG